MNAPTHRPTEELEFRLHGRLLAAKRWGTAGGRPTLALHGWLDNANSFDVLAPMLPELDIVALDFAGHGLSDHRQPGVNYLGVLDVQDAIGVAGLLGWQQFDLIGHSMGAEVGGNLIGLFPERVRRMVGIDGFTEGTTEERIQSFLRKSIEDNLTRAAQGTKVFASQEAMAVRVAEATGQSVASARLLVARGSTLVEDGFTWRSDTRVRWSDNLRLSNEQVDGILTRYPGQVLVIAAKDGSNWYRATVASRLGRFPNLQRIELPGNHHFHMDEETARPIAEAIRTFLAD
jgi:pimeloyl-ACP methyl ester carboxylesterase